MIEVLLELVVEELGADVVVKVDDKVVVVEGIDVEDMDVVLMVLMLMQQ
jgi:hypothetical protein